MRRLLIVLSVVVPLLSTSLASACGDKLLVLGRGARFQAVTADYPASILFYVNPDAPGSEKVEFTQLQGIMRQAGHRFRSVRGREELAVALKTARFDIVLADFDDASRLEKAIQASPSQPLLLPWVYQETKADAQRAKFSLKQAKERYRFALSAPFKVGNFLSTIDRTMEMKSQQAKGQAKARAKASSTKASLLP
jgi:DNA-binding NtrC family response regulator